MFCSHRVTVNSEGKSIFDGKKGGWFPERTVNIRQVTRTTFEISYPRHSLINSHFAQSHNIAVLFTGKIFPERPWEYLRHFDVSVVNSLSEKERQRNVEHT